MVKVGSARHTQYGTFRVVTKDSPGWQFPGVPPAKVFESISRKLEPKVKKLLQEGLALDLREGFKFAKSKM